MARIKPLQKVSLRVGAAGAIQPMVSTIVHLLGSTALVLDSPHSGTLNSADFSVSCDASFLRYAKAMRDKNRCDFAPSLGVHWGVHWGVYQEVHRGAHWAEANFPRSYLDANRSTTQIDRALFYKPWPGLIKTNLKTMSKANHVKSAAGQRFNLAYAEWPLADLPPHAQHG